MKCEVESCNEQTDSFLCEKHRKDATAKNAVFKICKKCNTIIDIHVREKEVDPNKRYKFVSECETCNFK